MLAIGAFAIISLRCANDYSEWSEKKNELLRYRTVYESKMANVDGMDSDLVVFVVTTAQISTSTTYRRTSRRCR